MMKEYEEININGIKIKSFESVVSTNDIALEESAEHLLTIVAERQTKGRGRMGRKFFSEEGGLYMSVIAIPEKTKLPFNLITPAAACAVYDALEKIGVCDIKIKWVNDILKNGKKVCGILTQAKSFGKGIEKIVIGIGINLKEPKGGFDESIKQKAAAIEFEGNRLDLAAEISKNIGKKLLLSEQEILAEYEKRLAYIGEERTFCDYANGMQQISGTVVGVNEEGFLKIRSSEGERILSSGEMI